MGGAQSYRVTDMRGWPLLQAMAPGEGVARTTPSPLSKGLVWSDGHDIISSLILRRPHAFLMEICWCIGQKKVFEGKCLFFFHTGWSLAPQP